MNLNVEIPFQYKPLFTDDYMVYVYYGGRGGGKSLNIALSLVILSLTKRVRILCIRESYKYIENSIKANLLKWIYQLNLEAYFKISDSTLSVANGSLFLFYGLRDSGANRIKSLADIDITWVDEAQEITTRAYNLLMPTITRTLNTKIIFSFNPQNEDDIVYKEYVLSKPRADAYVCKVNYTDNPFFKNSNLYKEMLYCENTRPESEFKHIWLGELATIAEDSLFINCTLKPLGEELDFNKSDFIKVVIACDPATTNKDYSNEYGVVVLGKARNGIIYILNDFSGNYAPAEFCLKVNEVCALYQSADVVVETNNGGDFIRALLLENNPYLNIKEVRATRDKVARALPLANLLNMEKVQFAKELKTLAKQMRNMTQGGYKGARGESPDRLDACVWGVYDLAGISEKGAIYTLFKEAMFKADALYLQNAICIAERVLYFTQINTKYAGVAFNIYKHISDFRLGFIDSFICDSLSEIDMRDYTIIRAEDIAQNDNLHYDKYESANERDLKILAYEVLPILNQNKVFFCDNMRERAFNGIFSNLLSVELMEFSTESKRAFYVIKPFFDIIFNEFGLDKDLKRKGAI